MRKVATLLLIMCLGLLNLHAQDCPSVDPTICWPNTNTGNNHTLLIDGAAVLTLNGTPIPLNSYIGVFYDDGGVLENGGYVLWTGVTTAFPAYGEDVGGDGFATNEAFQFKFLLPDGDIIDGVAATFAPITPPLITDEGNYQVDGFSQVLSLSATTCSDYSNTETLYTCNVGDVGTVIDSFLTFDGGCDSVEIEETLLGHINDDCANATPLIVGATCVTDTFSHECATTENPTIPNPSCGAFQGTDVWFTAVMPASGALRVEIDPIDYSNGSMEIYSGSCGGFSSILCTNFNMTKTINDPGLAGQTIYIRTWAYNNSTGGTFSICVWEPPIPVNDNCADAIFVPSGLSCNPTAFTNAFSTEEDVIPNPGCGAYNGADVWFKTVVPASGELRVELDANLNIAYAFYAGDCSGFTQFFCDQLDGANTLFVPELAGDTVYFQMWSYNNDEGDEFDLCFWDPPFAPNDACANSITIPVNNDCVNQSFDLSYATEETNVIGNPGCGAYRRADVWFDFVMPASGELRIELDAQFNVSHALYSGVCGDFTEVFCDQLDEQNTFVDTTLAGQTVYLRVWPYNSEDGGLFDLCLWDPPVPENNDCENAIALDVFPRCQSDTFNNNYATAQIPEVAAINPNCGAYRGSDVWFTAVMPYTGELIIEVQDLPVAGNPEIAVYTGTCGNFTLVECASLNNNDIEIIDPSLIGETLYIRNWNYNAEDGSEFGICAIGCIVFRDTVYAETCDPGQVGITVDSFLTLGEGCDSLEYTVTTGETEPPVAICQDVTAQLDASGGVLVFASLVNNGSTDNCAVGAVSLSQSQFNCNGVGDNPVDLYVTDGFSNSDTCSATITVQDNVAPVAMCQDITIQLDGSGNASTTAAAIDNGSNDACGIASVSLNLTDFICEEAGPNTVTLTVQDNNSNISTCQATVTVEDTIPPTAVCQDVTIQLDANGDATVDGFAITNGSSDNCAIASLDVNPSDFICEEAGVNPVTLTVTDDGGNEHTCQALVTVEDNIAPTAVCQDITISLNASGLVGHLAEDIDGGSSDNCGFSYVGGSATYGCIRIGPNTAILVIEDASGNSDQCNATVTVIDELAPLANCQDVTVELDAAGSASVGATEVGSTSTDNCAVSGLVLIPNQFDCSMVGENAVDLTASDNSGNSSTCTATITVEDNIVPESLCQDITVYLGADGMASISASDVDDGSNDVCGLDNLEIDESMFNCPPSSVEITLTATDANNNTNECVAIVTLQDTIPPVASCKDVTVNLDANGEATLTTGMLDNGSSDNCSVEFELERTELGCLDAGMVEVDLFVIDPALNTDICTSTITVFDVNPPIAACQDVTVYLDANGTAAILPADVDNGSTDECGVGISVSPASFDCSDIGANTVTLGATDAFNISFCTATVTVFDTIPPTMDCGDTLTVSADPESCNAFVDVPQPVIVDNCLTDNSMATILGVSTPGDFITEDNILGAFDQISIDLPTGSTVVDINIEVDISHTYVSDIDLGIISPDLTTVLLLSRPVNCSDDNLLIVFDDESSTPASTLENWCMGTDPWYSGNARPLDALSDFDGELANGLWTFYVQDFAEFDNGTINSWSIILEYNDPNGRATVQRYTSDLISQRTTAVDLMPYASTSATHKMTGTDPIHERLAPGDPLYTLTNDITGTDDASGVYPVGSTTVTWTLTDVAGQSTSCSHEVVVEDDESPSAVCQDITISLNPNGQVTIGAGDVDGGSSDNCTVTDLSVSPNTFNCQDINGSNSVILTVSDAAGNSDQCTAGITLTDPTGACGAPPTTDTIMACIAPNSSEVICVDDVLQLGTLVDGQICGNTGAQFTPVGLTCLDISAPIDPSITDTICVYHCDANRCDTTIIIVKGSYEVTVQETTCFPADTGTVLQDLEAANGCDSIVITITTLLPSDAVTLFDSSCFPQDTGTFVQDLENGAGCDSIVTTIVSLLPSDAVTIFDSSCFPQDTGTFVQDLENGAGCDSIVTTIVSLLPSDAVTIFDSSCFPQDTGTFVQDLENGAGCDSIVTTIVSLLPSDAITIFDSSCFPQDTGTFVQDLENGAGCDSIVTTIITLLDSYSILVLSDVCDPNIEGTFIDSLETLAGCDSVITTINTLLPTAYDTVYIVTCISDEVGEEDETFSASNGCDSIVTTITTLADIDPTAVCQDITIALNPNGQVTISGGDIDGGSTDDCIIVELTASPSTFSCVNLNGPNSAVLTVSDEAGNSDQCTANITLTDPTGACGADPITDTIMVCIAPNSSEEVCVDAVLQIGTVVDAQICGSTGAVLAPTSLTCLLIEAPADPSVIDTICVYHCDANRCDTTIIIVKGSYEVTVQETTCFPADTGTVLQDLEAANGCDSIVTTITTLLPSDAVTLFDSSCFPQDTGTFVQDLENGAGCDSIVTTIVSLLPSDAVTIFDSSCFPQDTGTFVQDLENGAGCDSIVTTIVSLLPSDEVTILEASCFPQDTGRIVLDLDNGFGCDSIVTVITELAPSYFEIIIDESCDPNQVGTFFDSLETTLGCDSVFLYIINPLTAVYDTVYAFSCDEDEVGSEDETLTAANGCDSIVTTITELLPSYDITFLDITCVSQEAGIFIDSLETSAGCDSIITTIVELQDDYHVLVEVGTCNPEDTGTVVLLLESEEGCDSTVTISTHLGIPGLAELDIVDCPGDGQGPFDYCLGLPLGEVLNYDLYIDGELYVDFPFICEIDTFGGYDFTTVIDNGTYGGSTFILRSWTVNGVNIVPSDFTYSTFEELVAYMNFLNPIGHWEFDTDFIKGGEPPTTSVYGLIEVFSPDLGTLSFTNYNIGYLGESTLLTGLNPGCQWITFDPGDNQELCADSILVCFNCNDDITPDTMYITMPVNSAEPDLCPTADDIEMVIGIDFELCNGGSLYTGSALLGPPDACPTYISGPVPGDFVDTICVIGTDFLGNMDTTVYIITIFQECQDVYVTVDDASCFPQDTGRVVETIPLANGCDSIVTTITTLLPSDAVTVFTTTCDPQQPLEVIEELENSFGCDSIVTTIYELLERYDVLIERESCFPQDTGTVVQDLDASNGCDSIVTTITTLLPSNAVTVFATTCDPQQPLEEIEELENSFGCDSIVTTIYELLDGYTDTVYAETCDPDQAGTTVQTFEAQNGCDSTITYITELLDSYEFYMEKEVCDPIWAGPMTTTYTAQNGCDSVVTIFGIYVPIEADFDVDIDHRTVQFTSLGQDDIDFHFWWFGDFQISFEANPEHTYWLPGVYLVKHLVWKQDCNIDLEIKLIFIFGRHHWVFEAREEQEPTTFLESLKAYPNPSFGGVTLDIELSKMTYEKGMLQIIDIYGRTWRQQKIDLIDQQLDLHDLPQGTYSIRIILNNEAIEQRVIIIK